MLETAKFPLSLLKSDEPIRNYQGVLRLPAPAKEMVDRADPDLLGPAGRLDHFRQQFGVGTVHLQPLLKSHLPGGLSLSR
jgi:hypothetical protein